MKINTSIFPKDFLLTFQLVNESNSDILIDHNYVHYLTFIISNKYDKQCC